MTHAIPTYFTYHTPVGQVTLASNGEALTHLAFGKHDLEGENKPSELTNKAANQLQEYFAGKRETFDLPLAPAGTDFQKQVWDALRNIPYGETCSYQAVAAAIGNPTASRAVGNANNKNPLPIIIPCHRVIGTNGTLGGYVAGAKTKEFLLELEHARC